MKIFKYIHFKHISHHCSQLFIVLILRMAGIFIIKVKFLSLWDSKMVLRFFMDNGKTCFKNLKCNTPKLGNKRCYLMFNELTRSDTSSGYYSLV